jgi:hypothetical protein
MEGKIRAPLILILFLRTQASDITLRYSDYLKQDVNNWSAKRELP